MYVLATERAQLTQKTAEPLQYSGPFDFEIIL